MLPSPAELKGKILIKGKRPNLKKEVVEEEEDEGKSLRHLHNSFATLIERTNDNKKQRNFNKHVFIPSIIMTDLAEEEDDTRDNNLSKETAKISEYEQRFYYSSKHPCTSSLTLSCIHTQQPYI